MESINRRKFLSAAALAGTGIALTPAAALSGVKNITPMRTPGENDKPALLGGPKAHPDRFSGWPVFDSTEEQAFIDALKTGRWGRLNGSITANFEQEYAKMMGVRHSLGVSSGTSALYTMLGALGTGPGDEVIIPVYTFVATYNVVVLNYALPILVDTDRESFQIDTKKMEKAITKETKVLMPVHIGGSPADIDSIMAIGQKHKLPVIEDACQAVMAEWKGKKLGSYGIGGAFSFQSSKNLNCAEGGAITSNDEDFIKTCYRFHNQGQGGTSTSYSTGEGIRGTNLRITEFQANLLLAQMTRLEAQANRRSQNADYLSKLFNEIPGIKPAKLYNGTTKSAYHLYMFRYDKSRFAGLSRSRFIEALSAEGVPCSPGYGQMNKDSYVTGLAQNKFFLKVYGEKTMKQWLERNQCPQNDLLTSEEAVWFTQNMLLGTTRDMDQIAEAVRKIQKNAGELK